MKVLDESIKGVAAGSIIALEGLNLPVKGTAGLLLVFWKEK